MRLSAHRRISPMPKFKLAGTDKQKNKPKDDAPRTLHFPDYTPWGEHRDAADLPADILESIEGQIDRAQDALDQLADDADVLFRIDSNDNDDDSPAAA